jgi:vancomycin resistance protein YoaR
MHARAIQVTAVIVAMQSFLGITALHADERSLAQSILQPGTVLASAAQSPTVRRMRKLSHLNRVAMRMQKRIHTRLGFTPPVDYLISALEIRKHLLKHRVAVQFTAMTPASGRLPLWTATLQEHPEWLALSVSPTHASYSISEQAVEASLRQSETVGLPSPEHGVVLSMHEEKGLQRSELSGLPRDGYSIDAHYLAQELVDAFKKGLTSINATVTFTRGSYFLATDQETLSLNILATGRSNFAHSPWGRMMNIKKAMDEKLDGIVIAPGETFSFNKSLGGPVTQGNGWYESLIIVNGVDLQPAPGGGICQAATTLYRAVVLAGLPVLERANHSLYVTYYKKFGLGIDATVFPGHQDFTFVNDTGNPLLITANVEGNDAEVKLYGVADGRTVDLQGPFFASTATQELTVNGRPMRSNEILWQQNIRYADGRTMHNTIVSRYNKMPQTLAKEYPQSRGVQELLHTAVPAEQPVLQAAVLEL